MQNSYINYLSKLLYLSTKYSIVNESDLKSYHDIFLSDIKLDSLRRAMREQDRSLRVECSDAFREYERFAFNKFKQYKEKLNVV